MTLTAPEIAALAALCLLLSACTFPHDPTREGIWIVKPAQMVRCEQTAAGVMCKSIQTIPADDIGI